MTPETAKALHAAGLKVAEWTARRNELIRQAVADGAPLRVVGEQVGLSHQAVKFIAHGRK